VVASHAVIFKVDFGVSLHPVHISKVSYNRHLLCLPILPDDISCTTWLRTSRIQSFSSSKNLRLKSYCYFQVIVYNPDKASHGYKKTFSHRPNLAPSISPTASPPPLINLPNHGAAYLHIRISSDHPPQPHPNKPLPPR